MALSSSQISDSSLLIRTLKKKKEKKYSFLLWCPNRHLSCLGMCPGLVLPGSMAWAEAEVCAQGGTRGVPAAAELSSPREM